MGTWLSADQVVAFNRDGFVCPVLVLTPDDAASFRRRFEAWEASVGAFDPKSQSRKLYLLQTWLADLVCHDRVLDAVETILDPDILCWGTSLFVKPAGDPAFVSWHQDATYWGLEPPDVLTAWIALSPATRESGCMKMVPGSHVWDIVDHRDTGAADNLLTRGQEIAVEVDEEAARFIELAPGEMSLHHVKTAHASEPNASDDRRIGIAVRYMGTHVRPVGGEDSALLVRGHDAYRHFIAETAPQRDMDPAAVAEHDRLMAFRDGKLSVG